MLENLIPHTNIIIPHLSDNLTQYIFAFVNCSRCHSLEEKGGGVSFYYFKTL